MNLNEKLKIVKLFFELNGIDYLYNEDIFKKVYENKYWLDVYINYKYFFDYSFKFLNDKLSIEKYIKIGDIDGGKKIYNKDVYFEKLYGYLIKIDFKKVKKNNICICYEEAFLYLNNKKKFLDFFEDIYVLTSKKVLKKINK